MDWLTGHSWQGLLTSVVACVLVYLWGVMGFSFLWVVIAWLGYIEHHTRRRQREAEREEALALLTEGEEAYLKVSTLNLTQVRFDAKLQMQKVKKSCHRLLNYG